MPLETPRTFWTLRVAGLSCRSKCRGEYCDAFGAVGAAAPHAAPGSCETPKGGPPLNFAVLALPCNASNTLVEKASCCFTDLPMSPATLFKNLRSQLGTKRSLQRLLNSDQLRSLRWLQERDARSLPLVDELCTRWRSTMNDVLLVNPGLQTRMHQAAESKHLMFSDVPSYFLTKRLHVPGGPKHPIRSVNWTSKMCSQTQLRQAVCKAGIGPA